MSPARSVGAYRRLLALYPKQFRDAYGEDMVFVFEEMLRDNSPRRVWSRTVLDIATSIIVQRMETTMSTSASTAAAKLRPVAVAAGAVAALIAFSAFGVENPLVFALTVLLASAAVIAALVDWHSHRTYVEPSDQMHRYWLRFAGAGAALIALVNIGAAVDLELPWLVLFASIILGIVLVAIGLILAIWHGADRIRTLRAA